MRRDLLPFLSPTQCAKLFPSTPDYIPVIRHAPRCRHRVRGGDAYRGILESNAEEFERMARMISDMLLLAKADNGLVVPSRETLNVTAEVLALFDYYDAVAEEKGLQLSVEGDGEVSADRLMLRRALGNLLSNAVRHAAARTTVRVRVHTDQDAVSIGMENTGDGIAQEYLERVFDRFFL